MKDVWHRTSINSINLKKLTNKSLGSGPPESDAKTSMWVQGVWEVTPGSHLKE